MSNFESTKGTLGDVWKPMIDADGDPRTEASKDDFIDGYYIDKKDGIGQHNSTVYFIKTDDGSVKSVWGTKALNDEMEKRRIGDYVRIQWLGKKLTKAGAAKPEKKRSTTDSFHDWEVFIDKSKSQNSVATSNASNKPTGGYDKSEAKSSIGTSSTIGEDDDLPFRSFKFESYL